MNKQELVKKLIEWPDEEMAEQIVSAGKETNMMRRLIPILSKLKERFTLLKKAIEDLESELENMIINTDPSAREQREITNSNKLLLENKISENSNIQELIRIQLGELSGSLSEEECSEQRDIVLNTIILNRADIYRIKLWIKKRCYDKNLEIDNEWYKQFGIYIKVIESKEDCRQADSEETEVRFFASGMKKTVGNGGSLLTETETQKEAIALLMMIPKIKETLSPHLNSSRKK